MLARQALCPLNHILTPGGTKENELATLNVHPCHKGHTQAPSMREKQYLQGAQCTALIATCTEHHQ